MGARVRMSIVSGLLACLLAFAPFFAQKPSKERAGSDVVVRMQQGSGSVTYEAPAELIAAMAGE